MVYNQYDKIFADYIVDTIPEKLKLNELYPCRRCGICCTDSTASMLSEELTFICKKLDIDIDIFKEKNATPETIHNEHGIKLKTPCTFYDFRDKKCNIYPIRPMSCRLYPFASLMVIIKPCKKGLDIYNAIEDWYKYKQNKRIDKKDLEMLGDMINDFYSKMPFKANYDHKILTDLEIEEVLKDNEIKTHGVTLMPEKEEMKKLIKFIKKKRK